MATKRKTKGTGGRKTVRTPENQAKLVQAIKMGSTHKLACQYAGMDESTFYRWMQDDSEFRNSIKEAEGAGAVELLMLIKRQAHEGSWQAGAWILERRYPEQYGRRAVDVKHSGNVGITWESVVASALGDDDEDSFA